MVAATTISGCGDDGEQTSPLAPSSVGTLPSTDEVGASSVTAATAVGMPATAANAPASNSDATTAIPVSHGADSVGSDLAETWVGTGSLPPGMTPGEVDAMVRARNDLVAEGMDDGIRRAHGGTAPSRVRNFTLQIIGLGHSLEQLELNWDLPARGATGSKVKYEAETERLDGGDCRGLGDLQDCHHAFENDRSVRRWRFLSVDMTEGWWKVWLRAYVTHTNRWGRETRHGTWTVAWINIDRSEAEPEPVSPPNVSTSSDGWTCPTGDYCKEQISVSAPRPTGVNRIDVRYRHHEDADWTFRWDSTSSFDVTLREGRWQFSARSTHTDGRRSEWSGAHVRRVEATSSVLANNGNKPSVPRNVRVAPDNSCRPDSPADLISGLDTNPDYDWDTCERWNISWDEPSSHGGWEIEKYGYGGVVYVDNYDGHPPARGCATGKTWSAITTNNSYITSDVEGGRDYGFTLGIAIPEGWTIGIEATNAKGHSDCVRVAPTLP